MASFYLQRVDVDPKRGSLKMQIRKATQFPLGFSQILATVLPLPQRREVFFREADFTPVPLIFISFDYYDPASPYARFSDYRLTIQQRLNSGRSGQSY